MAQAPIEPEYKAPLENYRLVFEDENLLVVDKPAGLLSVPGRGENKHDCLIHRVQQDFADALIVHRLDMDTSGLMLLARNDIVHRLLSKAFAERMVKKKYLAEVMGLVADDVGQIDLPLVTDWPNRPLQKVDLSQGKPSLTHYRVETRNVERSTTIVNLTPYTGRTHQLRVHMAELGHPILGDRLYAPVAVENMRLHLHASQLSFLHPIHQNVIDLTSHVDF